MNLKQLLILVTLWAFVVFSMFAISMTAFNVARAEELCTPSPTNTLSPTNTSTVKPTKTLRPTKTATSTMQPTATSTMQSTATETTEPTATEKAKPTIIGTVKPSASPTATKPIPVPTKTAIVYTPVATYKPTSTYTPTITFTPEVERFASSKHTPTPAVLPKTGGENYEHTMTIYIIVGMILLATAFMSRIIRRKLWVQYYRNRR